MVRRSPTMFARPLSRLGAVLLGLCLAAGCAREEPAPPRPTGKTTADSGAISTPRPAADVLPTPRDVLEGTHWPDANVGAGEAAISCDTDYASGDGRPLARLDYFNVLDALDPCRGKGLVRVHYRGKIDAGFADLVERVAAMATRMEIGQRILDLDSPGGQVEDAIRAGDAIGGGGWTLWVREGAVCHSACVLILAAGDNRLIAGDVGIHRMIRMNSTATTRAELNTELREVQKQLEDYLERNGAALAIADLMMTVPSRDLRMLEEAELREYGLAGANAVQEDLERIRLLRRCGEDFVRRKEGFMREFGESCAREGAQVEAMNACSLKLREQYGFPDRNCPEETPMAESGPAFQ
jgi:ATP-dependent protease ClpP protease subunit